MKLERPPGVRASDAPPSFRAFTVVPKLNVQTAASKGTMSFPSGDKGA
jgi:hypothetical protein